MVVVHEVRESQTVYESIGLAASSTTLDLIVVEARNTYRRAGYAICNEPDRLSPAADRAASINCPADPNDRFRKNAATYGLDLNLVD